MLVLNVGQSVPPVGPTHQHGVFFTNRFFATSLVTENFFEKKTPSSVAPKVGAGLYVGLGLALPP